MRYYVAYRRYLQQDSANAMPNVRSRRTPIWRGSLNSARARLLRTLAAARAALML